MSEEEREKLEGSYKVAKKLERLQNKKERYVELFFVGKAECMSTLVCKELCQIVAHTK